LAEVLLHCSLVGKDGGESAGLRQHVVDAEVGRHIATDTGGNGGVDDAELVGDVSYVEAVDDSVLASEGRFKIVRWVRSGTVTTLTLV